MKTPRFVGYLLIGSIVAFPVAFAFYWIYVSLLPGVFPYLWPMWIGAGMTLAVCYRIVHDIKHGKSI